MRKTILLGGLAALSLTVAGGVAVAQQTTQQQPAPHHARGDADGDGRVSRTEFVDSRVARLTAADANRDGTVTAEEMRAAMQAHRAERAAARFDRLDVDKNGQISREEFSARPDRGPRGEGPRMQRGGRHHGGPAMHGQKAGRGGERGPIVIAEARARAEQAFARLDTNSDGYVVAEERRAAMQQMREQRQERRAAHRAQRQASPSTPASE